MANSSSVATEDNRNDEPHVKPVWEIVDTFLVEAGGGHAEMSQALNINGLLREMLIEVGAAGGISGTVNVDLDDSQGVEFDTNASLAEGSNTLVSFNSGVGKAVNGITVRVDPSAAPTTGNDDWEIVVTCRGT